MFKRLRRWLSWSRLKILLIPTAIIAGIFILYFWRLGSLPNGLSPAEAAAVKSSLSWQEILNYPLNAPHRLLQYAALQIDDSSRYAVRLPSALFMTLFLGLFYLMLRLWFGRLVGLLGALLLASTPWTIIIARNATPDILLLAPLALITGFLWLTRRTKYRWPVWITLCLAVGLSLYIPGMIWFVAAAAGFKYKTILGLTKAVNKWAVWVGLVVFLVVLVPLGYGLIEEPALARELALIPSPLREPLEILKSIAWAGLSLIWRLPYPTDFTVGRIPLLSLTQIALAAFGVYAMWVKARRVVYWLAAVFGGFVLAAGINNRLTLLLPAVMVVCVLAAAGLRYLYVEWNSIFPRNPLPRGLAVLLMILLIGLQLVYGLRYAHIAWPHTPSTNSVYVIK